MTTTEELPASDCLHGTIRGWGYEIRAAGLPPAARIVRPT